MAIINRPVFICIATLTILAVCVGSARADVLVTSIRGDNASEPRGIFTRFSDVEVGDIILQVGTFRNPQSSDELAQYANTRMGFATSRIVWSSFRGVQRSPETMNRQELIQYLAENDTSSVQDHRPLWILRDSQSFVTYITEDNLRRIAGENSPSDSSATYRYPSVEVRPDSFTSWVQRHQQALIRLARHLSEIGLQSAASTVCDDIISRYRNGSAVEMARAIRQAANAAIAQAARDGAAEAIVEGNRALAENNISNACFWATEALRCAPSLDAVKDLVERVRSKIVPARIDSLEVARFYYPALDVGYDEVFLDPSRYRNGRVCWEGHVTQQLSATKFVLDHDFILVTTGARYSRLNLSDQSITFIGTIQGVERRRTLLGELKSMPVISVLYIDGF